MAQVCAHCKHVYEGSGRYRCPECKKPYDASQVDIPRYVPPPAAPEPDAPPAEERHEPARPRRKTPRAEPSEVKTANTPPTPTPVAATANSERRPSVFETQGIEGFDFSRLNTAKKSYHIELPDENGTWRKLAAIVGTSKIPAFGRNHDTRLAAMKWIALKHLRFENTSRGLYIQPYDTLNGVYRKILRPAELRPGSRFRVGNYIMTFRDALLAEPGETRVVEGEHLLARDLKPLGVIEFLRPDGHVGARFPLLKPEGVVMGRGGTDPSGHSIHVDLPLTGDPKVSASHARLSFGGADGEQCFLEDLGSKSGTWLQVEDRSPVSHGDIFWLGELYLRIVEAQ